MKTVAALLMVLIACPALAQYGPGREGHRGQGPRDYREYRQAPREFRQAPRDFQPVPRQFQPAPIPYQQMPPPERRMTWEDRQRLREQVRNGYMPRDEAREHWRQEREMRGFEPRRSLEERERMRRDVLDANRDLERR